MVRTAIIGHVKVQTTNNGLMAIILKRGLNWSIDRVYHPIDCLINPIKQDGIKPANIRFYISLTSD